MADSLRRRRDRHDLGLPDWGPYSKTHAGVSHIADQDRGLRVDFIPVPGLFRQRAQVPAARWDSDVHAWDAAADLSWYTMRHELLWKDRFYADVSYELVSASGGEDGAGGTNGARAVNRASGVRITVRFCNQTDRPLTGMLNLLSTLRYPNEQVRGDEPLVPLRARAPEEALYLDAVAGARLFASGVEQSPRMVADALLPGERRRSGFTEGRALALGTAAEPGGPTVDEARLSFDLAEAMEDAVLVLRYRTQAVAGRRRGAEAGAEGADGGEHPAAIRVEGLVSAELEPRPDAPDAPDGTAELSCGTVSAGSHELRVRVGAGSEIWLDCLVLLPRAARSGLAFEAGELPREPAIETDLTDGFVPAVDSATEEGSVRLAYPGLETSYSIAYRGAPGVVRELRNSEVDCFLPMHANDHVNTVLEGDGRWHFTDLYLRPVFVEAHSEVALTIDIASSEHERGLKREAGSPIDLERGETGAKPDARGGADSPFAFSQRLMRAVLLTNVVFPIATRYGYIRHNTPGKWWDSLYTWDSGFVALGLAELDRRRAEDCLRAYLTDEDEVLPFVLHGTPLPVQIFAARELWNRYQDRAFLEAVYPGLMKMYAYLAGQDDGWAAGGGSPTRPFEAPIIATWDLFYNSGGWDDYPAQYYVHKEGVTGSVAPVVSTAYLIRCARILASFARLLGRGEDEARRFEDDAEAMGEALQAHAYDEESGYFGYVRFDVDGRPAGILRVGDSGPGAPAAGAGGEGGGGRGVGGEPAEGEAAGRGEDRGGGPGENYNKGLDGISPLVSGILTKRQRERVFGCIESEQHLWTPIGISTVDQSASYYRSDGYWNGSVWMPHQWFLWKSLIDYGRLETALRVARTALELWEREAAESYNCYEHFIIRSGRGAGWHQFGGLSTPVLAFHAALFTPGRVTPGFEVRVDRSAFDPEAGSLEVELVNEAQEPRWLLVCGDGAGVEGDEAATAEAYVDRETAPGARGSSVGSTSVGGGAPEAAHLEPFSVTRGEGGSQYRVYGLRVEGGFAGALRIEGLGR
jgi:hypothetical protein